MTQNNCSLLVEQTSFLKLIMFVNCHAAMSHPLDCNPCTKIWTNLVNIQLLFHQLFEWLKLIDLSMAMIMGSVEDERCFSNLGFMKCKLNNKLTTYLDLVVRMFV